MLRKPFFSVIIPTLNEEDYLPKILSDLTKQKLRNFEIIIVDANSQDKTKKVALKFLEKIPLSFHSIEKKNVSSQRNFGAKKAKGDYLLFLDADARVDSGFTTNIYKGILKKKSLLFLPILTADEQSSRNKLIFRFVNSTIKLSQSLNKPLSAGGSIFIARKPFFDLSGFKEDLFTSEDHNLIQRARALGVKAKILKDVKVVFSLRRVRKEGEAVILYKYILSSIYMLINGEVKDKLFAYKMDGGDKYKNSERKSTRLSKFINKTSAFLTDSLS